MTETDVSGTFLYYLPCLVAVVILSVITGAAARRGSCVVEKTFYSLSVFPALVVFAGVLIYKYHLSAAVSAGIFVFAALVVVLLWAKGKSGEFEAAPGFKVTAILILVLAASAILRILLMSHTQFPLGDDSYFHCLYAKTIQTKGSLVFSMMPCDPMPLKYPWGMHVGLAFFSRVTAVPVHVVFKAALIWWSVVSVLGIFVVGRLLTGSDVSGLWAAFLYGLVANFGGIDYIRWGGLGNVIAMVFILAVIPLVVAPKKVEWPGSIFSFLLLLAAFLIHGSAALVVFVVLGAFVLIRGLIDKAGTRIAAVFFAIVFVSVLCGLLIAPDIFSHLAGLKNSASLAAERYVSIFDFPLMFNMMVSAAGVAGFIIISRRRDRGHIYIVAWAGCLLLGFVASRYVFGMMSFFRTGEAAIAFLPSRFVTDLVYPLCIMGGVSMAWGFGRLKTGRAATGFLTAAAVMSLLLFVPFQHLHDKWGQTYAGPDAVEAMCKLKRVSSPDSLIVNKKDAPGSFWVPYATGRAATTVSRPMLHHLDFENGEQAVQIIHLRSIIEELAFVRKDYKTLWLALNQIPEKEVYVYSDVPMDCPFGKLIYKNSSIRVYRLK